MPLDQFLVPQFIDVEDKIFGPITVRQFVIMIVAIVMGAIEYRFLSFGVFVIVIIITIGLAATFAFAKVNGRPIHYFILNFAQTIKRPMLRMWNKEAYVYGVHEIKSEIAEKPKPIPPKEPITGSKLKDLTLIINTGGVYRTDEDVLQTRLPEENITQVGKNQGKK
jgi:hypothetical protein